ncbi:hypothetical protein IJG76_00375 [Candidatus Saccharibacteria bacterium]|nr:hypothetical protein [Candidatus Saccharibacteria bacterium]
MNYDLTKKQNLVLDYIREYIRENGISPSYREIMVGIGISSVSAVAEHVDNLIQKGYLKKRAGEARGVELAERIPAEITEWYRKKYSLATTEERKILDEAAKILDINI